MSSENDSKKRIDKTDSKPECRPKRDLEEYLKDNPTQVKLISKDEDTAMTLWKSKDGSEFMLRMFYMKDCTGAILMDQFEFNRVAEFLMKESYS